MTDAELTLIATRIMDRAERDKALHLSSIVEELKAGIAIVVPPPTVGPMTQDELRAYEREILTAEMDVLGLRWTPCGTGIIPGRLTVIDDDQSRRKRRKSAVRMDQ